MHRARDVDDEDVVARVDLRRWHRLRRLDQREKKVLLVAAVQHQTRLDAVAGEAIAEDEIAVVRRTVGAGFQRHTGMRAADAIDVDVVRRRDDLLDCERRVERELQVERHRRVDAVRVVRGVDPTLVGCRALRTVVARPDHGRKHETVLRIVRRQELGVAQLDRHVVARHDVGDVHLEYVGPLLLEQRARLAFLLRRVVFDSRLLLLADSRGEEALAKANVHRVDGGLRRARKHVARFDRPLAFVAVVLRHGHVGDHAGDPHIDLGRLERQPVGAGVIAVDEEVRALGLRRFRVIGMRRRADHQQQRCHDRHRNAQQHAAGAAQRAHGVEQSHGVFSFRVVPQRRHERENRRGVRSA